MRRRRDNVINNNMRRILATIVLLSMILIGSSFQTVKQPQQPRQYMVTGTLEYFQGLLQIIDKSDASHLQVKAVQEWLIPQLQQQVQAEQMKQQDTVKAVTPSKSK